MFTGIIEEKGRIIAIRRGVRSSVLQIAGQKIFGDLKLGDSVAVNGVCLTVTDMADSTFTADVMSETLSRSSLGELKPGSPVNLERAMAADGRFGGHMVAGHIDGIGRVTGIRQEENAVWYTIAAEPELLRYIVEKGSVALDGISLTVAKVTDGDFQVSVIPHTRQETALTEKKTGSTINIECDIIGKYVEKLLSIPKETKQESRITENFLMEHGFF